MPVYFSDKKPRLIDLCISGRGKEQKTPRGILQISFQCDVVEQITCQCYVGHYRLTNE